MTQKEALNILKTGANVFLTGEPGSGKTHTVNAYVEWLREHNIEPAITASTGIAATHIKGMTIHSWSGIGIVEHMTPEVLDRISSKEHVARRINKTKVLIIDEISMLSGETLSMVDSVIREVKQNTEPFGGMQVVLVGDFFQLPPISRRGSEASFAFESATWLELNPLVCYLSEQHRQEDPIYLEILSAMRRGDTEPEHISALMTRETEHDGIEEEIPRLYTHNADVDRINNEKLQALRGAAKVFAISKEGPDLLVDGLVRGCLSPETLALKEGAVVMCTKNNPIGGYVNGTTGTVIGFEPGTNYPIISINDGDEKVMTPMDWVIEENGKIKAKITQIPLRLAWAITVHKSQGMSMDKAAIDVSGAFEYGQGYVALSRVRSLEGLYLLGWSEQALAIHPLILDKNKEFKRLSDAASEAFSSLEDSGERDRMESNFKKAVGARAIV